MNGVRILQGGTPEFLNELAEIHRDGEAIAVDPLTPQQLRDLETMGAAEQISTMRRIREVAHHWDNDARLVVAQRYDNLIRELSEASAFLRRRRGDVSPPPSYGIASSPFFRRQAGST